MIYRKFSQNIVILALDSQGNNLKIGINFKLKISIPMRFITGIILGALAGAVTGLLMAPESGKKTRDRLQKDTRRMKKDFEKSLYHNLNDLKKSFNDTIDKVALSGKNSIEKIKEATKS